MFVCVCAASTEGLSVGQKGAEVVSLLKSPHGAL